MVNKDYCLSQFLAFRYVFNDDMVFAEGLNRQKYVRIPNSAKTLVAVVCRTVFEHNRLTNMILTDRLEVSKCKGSAPSVLTIKTFRYAGINAQGRP